MHESKILQALNGNNFCLVGGVAKSNTDLDSLLHVVLKSPIHSVNHLEKRTMYAMKH